MYRGSRYLVRQNYVFECADWKPICVTIDGAIITPAPESKRVVSGLDFVPSKPPGLLKKLAGAFTCLGLSALLLFACLGVQAQNRVTATVTVTNSPYPTNGDTLTVNGSVFTWTNATPTARQILEDATQGGSASNLFNSIAANAFTGVNLSQPTSNSIALQGAIGQAMVVTLLTNWGSVTYYTQSTVAGRPVIVPISSEIQSSNAVYIASQLITDINAFATTVFSANVLPVLAAYVVTNLNAAAVFLETNLNVGGNLVVSNNVTVSGMVTAAAGFATTGEMTLNNPLIIGASPGFSDGVALAVTGSYAGDSIAEFWTYGGAGNDIAIDQYANLLIQGGNIQCPGGLAFTPLNAAYLSGIVVGLTNQSGLYTGTNNWTGDIAYPGVSLGSLANGNNSALALSINSYIRVSGPTSAFTICGLAGGRDGRRIQIENATGYPMTIANNSGNDPTAANRILTGTGADVITVNNPTVIQLTYDGSQSRWVSPSLTMLGVASASSFSTLISQQFIGSTNGFAGSVANANFAAHGYAAPIYKVGTHPSAMSAIIQLNGKGFINWSTITDPNGTGTYCIVCTNYYGVTFTSLPLVTVAMLNQGFCNDAYAVNGLPGQPFFYCPEISTTSYAVICAQAATMPAIGVANYETNYEVQLAITSNQ